MLNFLIQTIFFLIATCLAYVWVKTPQLNFYSLQLIAVLVGLFCFSSYWQKKKSNNHLLTNIFLNLIVFTMVAMLLIFATGGANSPLFFLCYFILLITSLLVSPLMGIVFALILIIFFILVWPINTANLGALSSLLAVSPLSYLLGKYYWQVLKDKGVISRLKQTASQQERNLKDEETNALMWLSLDFENRMLDLIQTAEELLNLPQVQGKVRTKLSQTLQKKRQLLDSGRSLKDKIDAQTD